MSRFEALKNLGAKVTRRVATAHKPLVRLARRGAREREHMAFAREAAALDRQIARAAAGSGPIIAGPWLAEVGYEVLYWIPFLRWFCDAHRVPPERLLVLSRGGMEAAYLGVAGSYVDLFDVMTPEELSRRGAERRAEHEGGGQKQSGVSAFDEALLSTARARIGVTRAQVLHPSLMFRLFRHAWHGNLPMDTFWCRTRYAKLDWASDIDATVSGLPREFATVKLYTGHSLALTDANRRTARFIVERLTERFPVISLDTPFGLDEHRDLDVTALAGVTSAAPLMTARTNLTVQLALLSRSSLFVGTCGGLAWLAPFLGVPTVGVFDDDHLLAPHLLVARQAGKRAGAASFTTLDLRAADLAGLLDILKGQNPCE